MNIVKTRYKTIAHEDYEVIIVDMKGEENSVGRVFKKFGQQKWSLKPFFKLQEKQKFLLHKTHYTFVEAGRMLTTLWEDSLFYNFFDEEVF
tara:strand:- start:329 stop:601 length:273 start_codon:yes stop_codon:yes gene_type:complete